MGVNVSGHVLRSRYNYVRKHGDDAYAKVVAELQPDTAQVFEEGVLETRWYPFDLLMDVMTVTDRVLGNGDLSRCYEMGAYSCEQNLTGIYRMFFRFGSIKFILGRAAKAFRSQYDAGEMQKLDSEDRTAVLRLVDFPAPHRAHCLAIKGWMVKAAELTGDEIMEITETCRALGDEHCQWNATFY
jgi:hypothetical protein